MAEYRLVPNSVQDRFGKLRTKVQVFGGGYGNGKTAAAIVQKVLKIAKEYHGANILVARSTYPKLNDTIRKEFIKWCPKSWIQSFPMSKNGSNTCTLTNGTTINFRYIAQQGKAASEADGGQTTSNLLSATYDLIVVDQLEDPEITEKDLDDLLGRLRGSARYTGTDPTMPMTGPRWFVACVNPTRNWVYRKLIAPLIKYNDTGVIDDNLMCLREPMYLDEGGTVENPDADKPMLDADGKPELLISLVEGSTYANKHNLDADFIQTLESQYRGQARDRFLYGKWAAYEGLVHPDYNDIDHGLSQADMAEYLQSLISRGVVVRWIEGYDFGLVQPSCYLVGFVDQFKNVMIINGFYEPAEKLDIDGQQRSIHEMRNDLGIGDEVILADPAVFRKTQITKNQGVKTIAALFGAGNYGVRMRQADNDVLRGITKVNTYLAPNKFHRHPITRAQEAPHLYIASELDFVANEFNSYYWKTGKDGKRIDEPVDMNDHAMNTIKYMLSKEPDLALRIRPQPPQKHLTQWSEMPDTEQRSRRHG